MAIVYPLNSDCVDRTRDVEVTIANFSLSDMSCFHDEEKYPMPNFKAGSSTNIWCQIPKVGISASDYCIQLWIFLRWTQLQQIFFCM